MKFSRRIYESRFNSSVDHLMTTIIGNLLIVTALLIHAAFALTINVRILFPALSVTLIYFLLSRSDWKQQKSNFLIAMTYLLIAGLEFYILGIPDVLVDPESHRYSKGMLLDFGLAIVPWSYFVLRIILVIPIMNVMQCLHCLNKNYPEAQFTIS